MILSPLFCCFSLSSWSHLGLPRAHASPPHRSHIGPLFFWILPGPLVLCVAALYFFFISGFFVYLAAGRIVALKTAPFFMIFFPLSVPTPQFRILSVRPMSLYPFRVLLVLFLFGDRLKLGHFQHVARRDNPFLCLRRRLKFAMAMTCL